MRLRIHRNLINDSSCIKSVSVNSLCYNRPFSVNPYFEDSFFRIKAVYGAVGVMSKGRVQPYVGPGRDSSTMTVAGAAVVETVHVDSIAEYVSGDVAIANGRQEFVV